MVESPKNLDNQSLSLSVYFCDRRAKENVKLNWKPFSQYLELIFVEDIAYFRTVGNLMFFFH